ncbi:MAG: PDZ domain-containing protein [Pirellulaceae bacterium]
MNKAMPQMKPLARQSLLTAVRQTRMHCVGLFYLVFSLATVTVCGQTLPDSTASFEAAIKSAVATAAPSLVQLEVVAADNTAAKADLASGPRTAVIVAPEGLAVTASVNIPENYTSIAVRLGDGSLVPATLIGHDESCRLALLEFTASNLPIAIAVPKSEIKVGQTAIAIGKSFSHDKPTVSVGIVSALNRFWGRAIQSDAKISPRNYGGALIDLDGRVFGVLLPLGEQSEVDTDSGTEWYDSGIGFAIPMADVMDRLDKWRNERNLKAGKVGLSFRKSTSIPAQAVVEGSSPGSPAATAGIKSGERVTGVDGQSIKSLNDFKFAMGSRYAGDRVKFTLEDDKKNSRSLEIELVGELPKYLPAGLGIIPSRGDGKGLVIDFVMPGSPAESVGLQAGDTLVSFNNEPVESWDQLRVAIRSLLPDTEVTVGWRTASGEGRKREVKLARQSASFVDLPLRDTTSSPTIAVEQMPEFANRYWLVQNGNADTPRPLLVWLLPPGASTEEQIAAQWKELEQHSAIVIAVESAKKDRWLPDDVEAVLRALGEVTRKLRIDSNRVAIGGADSSGEVASLMAAANRDRFQGLILVNSPLSDRLRDFVSAPEIPLAVLFASSANFSGRDEVSINQKNLFDAGISVGSVDLLNNDARTIEAKILRWLESIDRL